MFIVYLFYVKPAFYFLCTLCTKTQKIFHTVNGSLTFDSNGDKVCFAVSFTAQRDYIMSVGK